MQATCCGTSGYSSAHRLRKCDTYGDQVNGSGTAKVLTRSHNRKANIKSASVLRRGRLATIWSSALISYISPSDEVNGTLACSSGSRIPSLTNPSGAVTSISCISNPKLT